MITLRTIKDEVSVKVAALEAQNVTAIGKHYLMSAILSDHENVSGEDSDYALCCMRYTVEQQVDRYLRDIRKASEDEEANEQQAMLPGYERIQKRYIVARNDEPIIVLIQHMTDEEILEKAAQHRMMGDGHYRHSDELLRYVSDRAQPALLHA